MNRIRKKNNVYQVLITPDIKIAPDSSLLLGNWTDANLRGFNILEFNTLNDAQCEAYNYPDINWYNIVLNHQYIFSRLKKTLEDIIRNNNINVVLQSELMNPQTLKNTMFERVMRGGERYNLRYGMNNIISFTITNPWSSNLHIVSKLFENHREHVYRDDLRIRFKRVIDGNIILLYGVTEYGTTYEIRLMPTLLQQWGEWYKKSGRDNIQHANELYNSYLQSQKKIDEMYDIIGVR